jgi:CRP-like cAMP-binding protein
MADVLQTSVANRLLQALSPEAFACFAPQLSIVELHRHQTINTPNRAIPHVYFVETGVCSITAQNDRMGEVEVGLIGREGFSAVSLLVGADRSPFKTMIQIPGEALRIPTAKFVECLHGSAETQALLQKYAYVLYIQMGSTVVSNASSKIPARLSRWLLMCADRNHEETLPLVHEFIAMMLGIRRAGVSDALKGLERQGAIEMLRGSIRILDRQMLKQIAGSSYGMTEEETRKLMG